MNVYSIIDNFIETGSEATADNLIRVFRVHEVSNEEIAYLAKRMGQAGETIIAMAGHTYTDVASTGGPGSLSTLLCPLFLTIDGYMVPKLAVPGHPAGGIDIMAQVPGFKTHLTSNEVQRVLDKCGYAHFLSDERFAPRDALLFAYRQRVKAVNIPGLAIASLLSKKVAVGIEKVGLDVRVGKDGNFGTTWLAARDNASRFIRVAALLGIKATCFLTDVSAPCQPYLGRWEALKALRILIEGTQDFWLDQHYRHCYEMSYRTLSLENEIPPSRKQIEIVLDAHLRSQGSSLDQLIESTGYRDIWHFTEIEASSTGLLCVDIVRLRYALSATQANEASRLCPFPDPAGITFNIPNGSHVSKGDCVAVLRVEKHLVDLVLPDVEAAFTINADPDIQNRFEVVYHG